MKSCYYSAVVALLIVTASLRTLVSLESSASFSLPAAAPGVTVLVAEVPAPEVSDDAAPAAARAGGHPRVEGTVDARATCPVKPIAEGAACLSQLTACPAQLAACLPQLPGEIRQDLDRVREIQSHIEILWACCDGLVACGAGTDEAFEETQQAIETLELESATTLRYWGCSVVVEEGTRREIVARLVQELEECESALILAVEDYDDGAELPVEVQTTVVLLESEIEDKIALVARLERRVENNVQLSTLTNAQRDAVVAALLDAALPEAAPPDAARHCSD